MRPVASQAVSTPQWRVALRAGLAGLVLLTAAPRAGAQEPLPRPVLKSSPGGEGVPVSTNGLLRLSWEIGDEDQPVSAPSTEVTFEVEETSDNGETVLLSAGAHRAAALSGREDGLYRYRVRAISEHRPTSPWSEPIEVRVQHHSLAAALSVFAIGAVVFLGTTGLVLFGNRRSRQRS